MPVVPSYGVANSGSAVLHATSGDVFRVVGVGSVGEPVARIDADGAFYHAGDLVTEGGAAISGAIVGSSGLTLTDGGETPVNVMTVSSGGDLSLTGAATLSSTLAVTGASTFAGAVAAQSSLSVAGTFSVNSKAVVAASTGAATFDGLITGGAGLALKDAPGGSATFAVNAGGDVEASGDVAVGGAATVTGQVRAASLDIGTVSGAFTVSTEGEIARGAFAVDSAGALAVGGSSGFRATAGGAIAVGPVGSTVFDVTAGGALGAVSVSTGALSATGLASMSAGLDVVGSDLRLRPGAGEDPVLHATSGGDVTASGTVTVQNASGADTALSVDGKATVGELAASGSTTLPGAIFTSSSTVLEGPVSLMSAGAVGDAVAFGHVSDSTRARLTRAAADVYTLTGLSVPEGAIDSTAATKGYVDTVAAGLHFKEAARAASAVNVELSAPGAAVDGVTLASGDRVLLMGQTDPTENGVYVWAGAGAAMARAGDFDHGADDNLEGSFVYVNEGAVYGSTGWVCSNAAVTIGETEVAFTQFSGSGTFTAGDGLVLTGTQFSLSPDLSTVRTLGTTLASSSPLADLLKTAASGAYAPNFRTGGLALTSDAHNQDGSDSYANKWSQFLYFGALHNDARDVGLVRLGVRQAGDGTDATDDANEDTTLHVQRFGNVGVRVSGVIADSDGAYTILSTGSSAHGLETGAPVLFRNLAAGLSVEDDVLYHVEDVVSSTRFTVKQVDEATHGAGAIVLATSSAYQTSQSVRIYAWIDRFVV